jgi:mono/diheme cytochrome c family protein
MAAMAALLVGVAGGCGDDIEVAKGDPMYRGAELFYERCSGCHTMEVAAAQGSRPPRSVSGGERTNGPNFNVRRENREDVIYAIRNGGFSGAIMPANIVVGRDAEAVAAFVARYAGKSGEKGPGRDAVPKGEGGTEEGAEEGAENPR